MEAPDPFAQTDEQPGADPGAEVTPAAPMSGSPGARQPAEESTTATGGLGDGERLASAVDGSATIPGATTGTARPSGAEAGAASHAPEYGLMELVAREELTAPPEASQGMVRPTVRPKSPPVVPPAAMEEEDVVEEIIRAEPQTQSVRIFRKCGDEVVVIEEEDTPKEMRRLKSALAGVIKQIEVSTES